MNHILWNLTSFSSLFSPRKAVEALQQPKTYPVLAGSLIGSLASIKNPTPSTQSCWQAITFTQN
jgi:hypothetical protein